MEHMQVYYVSQILPKIVPVSDEYILWCMQSAHPYATEKELTLWKNMTKLTKPSNKQVCIYLNDLGYSQTAIAKLLDISQANVSYHLSTRHKAKKYVNLIFQLECERNSILEDPGIDPFMAKNNLHNIDLLISKHRQRKRVFRDHREVYTHYTDPKTGWTISKRKTWSRKPKPDKESPKRSRQQD